jgi:hypothetical protein
MHGTTKQRITTRSGKFKIIYGETIEYGMGGPYAHDIYIKLKGKSKILISEKCYGDAIFAQDESCIYFLYLNNERKIQVAQFDFECTTLNLFKDTFDMASFESAKTKYTYAIIGKTWIASDNKYSEGMIICDTKDKNIERKTIFEINF